MPTIEFSVSDKELEDLQKDASEGNASLVRLVRDRVITPSHLELRTAKELVEAIQEVHVRYLGDAPVDENWREIHRLWLYLQDYRPAPVTANPPDHGEPSDRAIS